MTRAEALGYTVGFVLAASGLWLPPHLLHQAHAAVGTVPVDVWFRDVAYDRRGRPRRSRQYQVAHVSAVPGVKIADALDNSGLFDWRGDRRREEYLTQVSVRRQGKVKGRRMKVRGPALYFRQNWQELPLGIFEDTIPATGSVLEIAEIYWG